MAPASGGASINFGRESVKNAQRDVVPDSVLSATGQPVAGLKLPLPAKLFRVCQRGDTRGIIMQMIFNDKLINVDRVYSESKLR